MKKIITSFFLIFLILFCKAQDEMPTLMQHDSTMHHHHEDSMEMSHAFSRNLPVTRNGSGTGWLPDASVMYGHGMQKGGWMYMMMANIFVRHSKQDLFNAGSRGGKNFDAPNWFMFSAQKNTGKRGLFRAAAMLSLDPLTVGDRGYPLLFQTGETYNGKKLVDRQHPHDLFTELSVAYTHMISKDMDLTAYAGYPGEPAIGPVTFMHRLSALNNPDAPLSHHWQDATHITFGVATFGFRYRSFKFEVSDLTGKEPDENRYNFDRPRFDSWSWRVQCSPERQLALQFSQAYLKGPEAAETGKDVIRTTASVIHQYPLGGQNRYLSTSVVWGLNTTKINENAALAEMNLQLDKTAVYGRYEWVQKSASELDLTEFNKGHETVFEIQQLTIGLNRVIYRKYGNNAAIGMQATIYYPDSQLTDLYGQYPFAGEVYLRFYPHLMHIH